MINTDSPEQSNCSRGGEMAEVSREEEQNNHGFFIFLQTDTGNNTKTYKRPQASPSVDTSLM